MPAMTTNEIDDFLATDVLCRLACVDATGHPHVVPCWFTYAEGGFFVVPRARAAWATFLKNDQRVSLCIDAEDGRRVLVQGTAQVVEEPNVGGRWVEIAHEMVLRYSGEAGLVYLEATMEEPRWLFFIAVDKLRSSTGGWAKRYKHSDW